MLAMYLFTRYLDKLDDYKFIDRWENKIIPKSRVYFISALIYVVIAIGVISNVLLIGVNSIILSLFIFFIVTIVYGYYFLKHLLKFMAKHNSRLMSIKMGTGSNNFSKDNVVG